VLLVTTLIGLVISVLASALIVPERWVEFAIAVCTYLVVGAISRFALTVLQMQQRDSTYSLLEFMRAVLQLVLPVLAIWLFSHSFLMVSLASSAAALLAGIVALRLALDRVVAGPARFTYRELFALGVPLIAVAVVGFGLNSAERVLLKLYYDAGAVAVFAAAYALARQPIDTIANAINMGGFPEMVSRFDQDGSAAAGRFLSQQMALMARLCLPVAALLVVLSEDVVDLLLPEEYQSHIFALFAIIAVSVLATNLSTFVFMNVIHAHKKPWMLIGGTLPGSVVTIGLSLLLIPPYAEEGAALALCGGALVSLAAFIYISSRLTPVPIPWRDLALSLGLAVATGIAGYAASHLPGNVWSLYRLAAGGTAGMVVFLGLLTWLYPAETLAFFGKLRRRLRPN
jgi:O-antigen/teichoic acid export membrane protein